MKKVFFVVFMLTLFALLCSCEKMCWHSYSLISSEQPTCAKSGYELYQCTLCQETKKDEIPATGQHSYTNKYVCAICSTPKECTLEVIKNDFSQEMLAQARQNARDMDGNFQLVILEREETLANLQNYVISSEFDSEKLVRGLFVKLEVTNFGAPFTVYYNFGLEFNAPQEAPIAFTVDGWGEAWVLETVSGNRNIVFEYSIVE